MSVLRTMYSSNTGDHKSGYPVSGLMSHRVSPHIVAQGTMDWSQAIKVETSTMNVQILICCQFQDCIKSASQLFSASLFRITITMIVINFAIQFGYYGLWLWFPELFNKLEKFHAHHSNETLSVCQVVSREVKYDVSHNVTTECSAHVPDQEVFVYSFIISLSSAPTNIWTIFHMDKLGRKFFLCLSMLLSGCSAFLIYLVSNTTMNLILSCIFGAVSTMGFNSLDCLGIELFPTQLRYGDKN